MFSLDTFQTGLLALTAPHMAAARDIESPPPPLPISVPDDVRQIMYDEQPVEGI